MATSAQSSDRAAHVLSLMKEGDDAFNRHDIEAMNAAHHPDMIAHVTGNDQPIHGRAAHAAAMEGMFRASPTSTSATIPTRSSSAMATE